MENRGGMSVSTAPEHLPPPVSQPSSPSLTCSLPARRRKTGQSETEIRQYGRLVEVLSVPLLISTVYGFSLVL